MIVVGTSITSEDVKVGGMFIDGSHVVTISTVTPPNPPVNQDGKNNELHLNTTTNELYWVTVDRPLTDSEKLKAMEEQNAQMLLALVAGGLM